MMRRLKLSRWLYLITAATLIPLVGVLSVSMYLLHSAREKQAHDEVSRTGELIALELQRVVSGVGNVLLTISSAPVVQNGNLDQCSTFLKTAVSKLDGVATLGVIGPDGIIRCRQDGKGLGTSVADRLYFQEAMRSSDVIVGEYIKSKITGSSLLPFAVSYRDDKGNVLGVIAMTVDLQWLQRLLSHRALPPGASVTVADKNGVILARHPLPEKFVGNRIPAAFQKLVHADAPGTLELTSQDGTRRILAYIPVNSEPRGLYVSTGVSVDDTFASIRNATTIGLFASVLTAALAVMLSLQISRHAIRRPVERIVQTVNRWRGGDVNARSAMKGEDEFGLIASAFDDLLDDLAAARKRNELIMSELDHRVKNVFALIQSIVRQSLKDENVSEAALTRLTGRLRGIAQTFSTLGSGDWQSTALDKVVRASIAPFNTDDASRFDLTGPFLKVNARAALALGMALHELATNAVKYGALSTSEGRVIITWALCEGEELFVILRWVEQGGPLVSPPSRKGFGSTMLHQAIAAQLDAKIDLKYEISGLDWSAKIPKAQLTQSDEV